MRIMDADSQRSRPEIYFDAWLRPPGGLSRLGVTAVLGLVSVGSLGLATAFVVVGAWPVAGFVGLDVVALALAFLIHARARGVSERITLTARRLLVARFIPGRPMRRWGFEPTWLRVAAVADAGEDGGAASGILLSSHGTHLTLGSFLTEEECRGLVAALRDALALWRDSARFSDPAQEAGG